MSACEIVLVRFLFGNQTRHVGLVQSRYHLMKAYPCSPHDIPVAENLHILLFTYMFTQAYPCSPHDIPVAEKNKGPNRISKHDYGHLCLKEEHLSFNNNYII